jgi:hypothetical protein
MERFKLKNRRDKSQPSAFAKEADRILKEVRKTFWRPDGQGGFTFDVEAAEAPVNRKLTMELSSLVDQMGRAGEYYVFLDFITLEDRGVIHTAVEAAQAMSLARAFFEQRTIRTCSNKKCRDDFAVGSRKSATFCSSPCQTQASAERHQKPVESPRLSAGIGGFIDKDGNLVVSKDSPQLAKFLAFVAEEEEKAEAAKQKEAG